MPEISLPQEAIISISMKLIQQKCHAAHTPTGFFFKIEKVSYLKMVRIDSTNLLTVMLFAIAILSCADVWAEQKEGLRPLAKFGVNDRAFHLGANML